MVRVLRSSAILLARESLLLSGIRL
jgi:hypothetical protein